MRSAGRTTRLYRNGVLHTAYHPDRILGGSVWDLLFLPAFLRADRDIKRVLVLGVGGGALLHMYRRVFAPRKLVGVDIDSVHLHIAKQFFDLNDKNQDLILDDGVAWARRYQGEPFDIVIEDMFTERDQQPVRLMHAQVEWLNTLRNLTRPGGLLIINHGDLREAKFTKKYLLESGCAISFSLPHLHNRVLAYGQQALDMSCYRKQLKHYPQLDPAYVERISTRAC
ncbi:MAG: methyltransferase domain-containing protein [Myxococcales bacterium]|nr:MAG: methyltransferase domain-containing protein [Myxococcales bacterium]